MPKAKKCQLKSTHAPFYKCPESALEGSDYCIYHKPHKTKKEIKLFEKAIDKKLQDKDYDFRDHRFPMEVIFTNQVFEKGADFRGSTFEKNAFFVRSTFKGHANFAESTFLRYTEFRESTFEQYAHFRGTIFKGETYFVESSFEKGAYFGESRFERGTCFRRTIFERGANFGKSTFLSYVDFDGASFQGYTDFTSVIFTDNLSAEGAFRIAKSCYQRQGDYTRAGEYYYKERIAKRKQLPWYSPKRWLEYLLLDGLCGYGERPLRAIRTGLGVVFGLALLYWRIGHIYPSPELFKEPDHALTFLDALYFSVVTFTTLGFGDWRPDPSHWIRYVVMSEAFIGAFLMALFIVTFARRMMR